MSERLETQQELETLKAWKSSSDSEKTALSAQVASLEVSWQWNRWKVEQQFFPKIWYILTATASSFGTPVWDKFDDFDSYRCKCTLKMINPIKDFKTFSLTQAQLKGVKSEDGAV